MIISDEDRDFVQNNIPEAISLLDGDDVRTLLRRIFDYINIHGFAPPHYEDYNALGRKAQGVYDRIYEANVLNS